jgi:heme exporter protein A
MSGALDLRNVTCERGGRRLFSAVTQSVDHGQLLRVHGDNGAGKTSLLRMICGLIEPTDGQVLWRDQPTNTLKEELGRELIYLGHAAALKDELSPIENLQAACTLSGHSTSEHAARRALDQAGLRGHENTAVRKLSQGQRKRSALARLAIWQSSPNPQGTLNMPLWVLDEPFNSLDSTGAAWLVGLIKTHLQHRGVVVLTSHLSVALEGTAQQELAL